MTAETSGSSAERWRNAAVWSMAVFAGTLPFSHVPAQLALGAGLLSWMGWSIRSGRIRVVRDTFFIAASVYWGWNLMAAAVSERPVHSLLAVVDNEWPALAGVLLLWTVRSFEDLRRILLPFFGASAIAMVVGLGQTLTGVEWVHGAFLQPVGGGFHRAIGFSGFSLTFAASTMCALCLAWGYAMARPEVSRRWILPPLALLSILGTFARGIWMSIGILIPIVAWSSGGRRSRWLAVAVWLTGAIVVLAVEPLRDRAFSMFDLSRNENRLNLWRTSWAIFEANPVLGIGQDNFSVVFERFRVEGYYDTIAHPHNDYLSVLVHGGLPAFIAFLGMWGIALKRGWDNLKRRESGGETAWVGVGATAALAGLLLSAFFQNYYGTFVNCFNWWFITGIILATYHLLNKPIQSNS